MTRAKRILELVNLLENINIAALLFRKKKYALRQTLYICSRPPCKCSQRQRTVCKVKITQVKISSSSRKLVVITEAFENQKENRKFEATP